MAPGRLKAELSRGGGRLGLTLCFGKSPPGGDSLRVYDANKRCLGTAWDELLNSCVELIALVGYSG